MSETHNTLGYQNPLFSENYKSVDKHIDQITEANAFIHRALLKYSNRTCAYTRNSQSFKISDK